MRQHSARGQMKGQSRQFHWFQTFSISCWRLVHSYQGWIQMDNRDHSVGVICLVGFAIPTKSPEKQQKQKILKEDKILCIVFSIFPISIIDLPTLSDSSKLSNHCHNVKGFKQKNT